MSEVLAIIPARVGSKGIPGKNFKPLGNLSPVSRAVICAVEAGLTNIVISTDNAVYPTPWGVQGGKEWRGRVHYAYAPLHTDTCSMIDVMLDVLKHYPGPPDQKVLLVQPTQPLREPKHLEQAIAMLDRYPSVASVVEVEPAQKLYLEWFISATGAQKERRQECEATYACDGTVYGFRRAAFVSRPEFISRATKMLIIPPSETARLDTPFDWEMAELRLRARSARTSERSLASFGSGGGGHSSRPVEPSEMPRNSQMPPERSGAQNHSVRGCSYGTKSAEHQPLLPFEE